MLGTSEAVSTPSPGTAFRKGKWTPEEEAYLGAIVKYFNAGLLNIPTGKSLRSLLSEKLNCDPMRITKKYSGSSAVGKQTFVPCEPTESNLRSKAEVEEELNDLQQKFLLALSMMTSDSYESGTLIADGSGSWMAVEEHTFHFSKKSKIHKSASAPSLNRMIGGISEDNIYINRPSLTSQSESRTRSNSLKAYAMDDAAAGNLLLDFFECVRSGYGQYEENSSGRIAPMSTIVEGDGSSELQPGGDVNDSPVALVPPALQPMVLSTPVADNLNHEPCTTAHLDSAEATEKPVTPGKIEASNDPERSML